MDIQERLTIILSEVTGIPRERINPATKLSIYVSSDSVWMMEFFLRANDEYEFDVPVADLNEDPDITTARILNWTLAELAEFISSSPPTASETG